MVYITHAKENRIVVGSLLVDRGVNHRYSTLVPRDCRIPKLLVDTSIWPAPINLKKSTRESIELFYAVLPKWDDNVKYPKGYDCAINVQFIISSFYAHTMVLEY